MDCAKQQSPRSDHESQGKFQQVSQNHCKIANFKQISEFYHGLLTNLARNIELIKVLLMMARGGRWSYSQQLFKIFHMICNVSLIYLQKSRLISHVPGGIVLLQDELSLQIKNQATDTRPKFFILEKRHFSRKSSRNR